VRVLAAIGVVAAGAAVLSAPAYAHGFSPRVASGLAVARAPLGELRQVAERRSFGTTIVHVQQRVGGIPVLGSDSTLSLGADGEQLLLDHTWPRVAQPAGARLSRATAVGRARSYAHVQAVRAPTQASRVILPKLRRLAWRVVLPASRPLGDFEVLVDARSGALVRLRNLIKEATTPALVFDPNPVVEQGSRAGLLDNNNSDTGVPASLYRKVTLEDLNAQTAGCLSGLWVNALVNRGATCPPGRDFSTVTRSKLAFDAAMAYFHIDRIQRYLQSLGFSNVVHRAITVNLHATSEDNSFYSPTTGALNFGDGGVNDAQDADVISHEYGHAIQDSQVAGFGVNTEGGTLGEGFGDYWQAAISAQEGSADVFNTCFAEWDTSAVSEDELPCLRRVDNQWTVAQAVQECGGREIHCVGQAWANLLWTIRKQLGGTVADRMIIQSQFSYAIESGFRDAALALLFADQQLNGGANRTFLLNLLGARGFVTQAQLDDQPSGAVPLAFPGQATGAAGVNTDDRDVFAVPLTAGAGVVFQLHSSGAFFTLALYGPETVAIERATSLARSSSGSANPRIAFTPSSPGTYYLVVGADAGDGTYTVSALPDADHDGAPNASDNCPAVANPTQADWNKNGKGDACDRASRTTIDRVTVRGHTITVSGDMQPRDASAAFWSVEVRRAGKIVGRARGSGRKGAGRAVAVVTVPARVHGRVQVRAVLQDRRYNRAVSRTVSRTLR
jgi:fungalysin metallopeptidase (M36)/pre-peptidase/fungalysin/thermolysin propeptide/thrombospondin type 3 repeat protein